MSRAGADRTNRIALLIDAMELLYSDAPDAFGLVSSDADFTPLVMHLRAKGATVYGFGARKTPEPFVNACSRFLFLDQLQAPDALGKATERPSSITTAETSAPKLPIVALAAPPMLPLMHPSSVGAAVPINAASAAMARSGPVRLSAEELGRDAKLIGLLRGAVIASEDESGWSRVGAVGTHIGNKASFDARNDGYATWSKRLAAVGVFELSNEGTSSVAVRDRRHHNCASKPPKPPKPPTR